MCLARRPFFFFEKKETKKTLSVPLRRSEMILPRRPPVNFDETLSNVINIEVPKFLNGLHRKYWEQ
jgi:hypothetical protein